MPKYVYKNSEQKKQKTHWEHQTCILEWFLKDDVTLKTRTMTAENSAWPSQE